MYTKHMNCNEIETQFGNSYFLQWIHNYVDDYKQEKIIKVSMIIVGFIRDVHFGTWENSK